MKKMKKVISLVMLTWLFSTHSFALEKPTHRKINETVVTLTLPSGFNLNSYLKTNLGFSRGIGEVLIDNKTVQRWVALGGQYEDAPFYSRSRNHFHNPLLPWVQAGLTDWGSLTTLGFTPMSAILWAQDQSGASWIDFGGDWSWKTARKFFYAALTGDSTALDGFKVVECALCLDTTIVGKTNMDAIERNKFWVWTFRAVGQVMHLLEDMSVPSHTRNDAHLFYNYEKYVDKISADSIEFPKLLSNPVFFGGTITGISSFFDTNQYSGANPQDTISNTVGLAEFTNANYFSDDTIPNNNPTPLHLFTFPQINNVNTQICEDYAPSKKYKRKYISRKQTQDEQCPPPSAEGKADHFAAISLSHAESMITNNNIPYLRLEMDDNVHKTYAQDLLPRAVGYSAGLIDYFFRGQIELTPPDRFIYGITTSNGSFQEIRVKAKNITTTGEDMSNGQIWLVIKYKVALEDPFQSYPAPTTPDFYYIVVPEKNNINTIPKDMPIELTFDLSTTPIPLWATDIYMQIVYKGQLGSETETVAVGFKDISEPTPIDIVNGMDYICINGSPYIAGSDEAITAVDTNGNGKADEWDVFAHGISSDYLKFSSVQSPQNASTTNYNAKFTGISPASYGRVFILTEESYDTAITISSTAYSVNIDSRDTYLPGAKTTTWNMKGIRNQTNYIDGITYIYYPILSTERGLKVWGGIKYMNRPYPAGSNYCDISNMQPDLSGPSTVEIPQ